jgi:hypothetical protein
MTMAMGMFAVVATGIAAVLQDSDRVMEKSMRSGAAREDVTQVIQSIVRELEQSNALGLQVDNAPNTYDGLTLQTPLGANTGVIEWGARQYLQGQWTNYVDHSVTYFLAPDMSNDLRLIRRILDPFGNVAAPDEILAVGVDAPNVSGKGFLVTRSGNLVTVGLRLRAGGQGGTGEQVVRSRTSTVRLRNS